MATLADALVETDAPPARRSFAHALVADGVWLSRLRGESTEGTVLWPDLDADTCRALASRTADAYATFLDGLTETGLDRVVRYTTSAGAAYDTRVGDVLDHVLLHAAHHRGQVNQALRAAGAVPPHVDLIAWLRLGEPA